MNEIDEIAEAIRKWPGQIKWFGAWERAPNVEQSIDNGSVLVTSINRAQAAGCFVEVLSLKLQFADDWLRYFIKSKAPQEDVEKLREFGKVVTTAEGHGFDQALVDRLRAFATARNHAQHGFVAGRLPYAAIEQAAQDHAGLVGQVYRQVLLSSGKALKPADWPLACDRGDKVINVAVSLDMQQAAPRL